MVLEAAGFMTLIFVVFFFTPMNSTPDTVDLPNFLLQKYLII